MGIYAVFTFTATLCALLSILSVHCGYYQPRAARGPRISARADVPAELRSCHKQLKKLLSALVEETFSLPMKAGHGTDPTVEWRNWSDSWRHSWEKVNHRCRLEELSGTGKSPEIDRMAPVHSALAELQLSFGDLVVDRFIGQFVDRTRQLRSELATIRGMIDRRKRQRKQ